jgi:hypothetical protein
MVSGFPELIYEDSKQDQLNLGPNGTSLDLLQAIYRNPAMPLHTRMRAAMSCLQHEHPKLGITFQANETDFATLLDERLRRMEQAKLIQHQPQRVEIKPPLARTHDRRFRRI